MGEFPRLIMSPQIHLIVCLTLCVLYNFTNYTNFGNDLLIGINSLAMPKLMLITISTTDSV